MLGFMADAEARLDAQGGSSSSSSSEGSDEDKYGVEGDNKEVDSDWLDEDGSRAVRHQGSCRREEKKDLMKDARELFCWTEGQKKLATTLWRMLDDGNANSNADGKEEAHNRQLKVLLDLLTSFFFTTAGDKPFSSGLVHFLAVLGIDADTNRLRTAKNYSYMLAGMVYCMRVLSVEQLLPSACRNKQTDEDRVRFLEHREKYLADGSYSPMSEALSLLAYGKHVALAAGNAGNAYWSKDNKIFYLHGRPVYISRFCKMAQDMVAEVEQMLWEELFWVPKIEERFAIKLDQLLDDVTFERRGMSFVQHHDNKLRDKLAWMLTRTEQTEQGRRL